MRTAVAAPAQTNVFLTASWRHLAMLNFTIDSGILEPHVPPGTELDLYDGRAYVSVVGFQFLDTRVLGLPLWFHRDFEEVNLRFYVVRHTSDGPRRGVVFLREIAPKRLISLAARWFYNERYVTMPMRRRVELPASGVAGRVQYEWQHGQRWQGLCVRFGGELLPLTPGSEEEFIAEHYWGYTKQIDGTTMEYQVEHPAWRVWQASSATYDCDVEANYGKEFAPFLREPTSFFVADGSEVLVRRGQRLATAQAANARTRQ
jgi:uncharacterized protein YqjF (DUF2071 family)